MAVHNREDNLRALGLDPWEVPTAEAQSTKGKFMNWQQALSALRTAISAGGPLSGLLIALGYTHTEELSKGVEALIVLASVIPPVLGGVWGWFTHKQSNAIAVVAAIPEIRQVVVSPSAPPSSAAGAAAVDPLQPKVTR